MILADTSVWVEHFRRGQPTLIALLENAEVVIHPFVVGELALGHLPRRVEIIEGLNQLPQATAADAGEVLSFIDRHGLAGAGLGYVDVHLLTSSRLTSDTLLWTFDKRLHAVADRLSLAAKR
jgi:predicted nucleic acid-binding protein